MSENEITEAQGSSGSDHLRRRPGRLWNRAKDIVFMVVAVLFLRTFVVQAYQIPSGSMENTLLVGDFLIANKMIYGPHIPFTNLKLMGRMPKGGDIVIFRSPADDKDYIKRCIATPGETVEIRDNRVFIDGVLLDESYVAFKGFAPPQADYGPIVVPEKNIFVLGDNRNRSYDSRFWGTVDEKLLRGKAEVIHWSWDKDEKRPRISRVGDLVR